MMDRRKAKKSRRWQVPRDNTRRCCLLGFRPPAAAAVGAAAAVAYYLQIDERTKMSGITNSGQRGAAKVATTPHFAAIIAAA
jgi:hypothetical protein